MCPVSYAAPTCTLLPPGLSPPAVASLQNSSPLVSRTLDASESPARPSVGAIVRDNIGLIAGVTVCGIVLILLGTLTEPFRKLQWKGWFSLVLTVVMVCLLAIEILPTHVVFGTVSSYRKSHVYRGM